MASKFLTLGAFLLAAVSASPCKPPQTNTTTPITSGTPFNLMTLRSGSEIHFAEFQAALLSIFVGLPSQNATCDDGSDGPAVFTLGDNGEIYLYNKDPSQMLFADRSGMGQGKLGYLSSTGSIPAHFETTGWVLDESNDLTLNGNGFQACPNSIDGAWSIWMTGVTNPAGNSGCLGITARAVVDSTPASCTYTGQ